MNLPKHIAQASIFITHRYLQLAQVVTSHLGVHPSSYIQLARDTIQTDRYESNLDYHLIKQSTVKPWVKIAKFFCFFFVNNAQ